MKRTLPILAVACLLLSLTPRAQLCGFDAVHRELLRNDPSYARQTLENNRALRDYLSRHSAPFTPGAARGASILTIPVVVHVMHTGGAPGTLYNPTDAQIQGAIDYLNEVYAGTHPGMTPASPGGAAGDMGIRFALAQRTPSCGSTNGIDRVDASGIPGYTASGVRRATVNGCSDLTLKNLARWNASDYYNIWVVNKIDGADGTAGQFIAGYAYFPGAPSTLDGTVMLATQMQAGEKTLPHEIGHALDLLHTFEGSDNDTQCPADLNCLTDGDLICDTDPISQNYNTGTGLYNFSCRTGNNGCTSGPTRPYSPNTESNFMSYTNCYTLFTNDQQARIQAALSLLPSRTSLVAPTNLSLVPCGTTINFTTSAASHAEDITGTPAGCRLYKDYTYQMTIGNGPTATATATLMLGGTAARGLDYEITTNGDFSSPNDVLTFNAGSILPQSFTIRIYDDANVESAESVIIDFLVNNGGGDAAKGTTIPNLALTITDNDFAPQGSSSGTYAIGSTLSYVVQGPFASEQASQRSQLLYRASELTAAGISPGNITAMQLLINTKLSTRAFGNFSIKMGHTALPRLVTSNVFTEVTGLTTVYAAAAYTTTAGWNNFILSTPFAWNGTDNLAIEICYDNGTPGTAGTADQTVIYPDGSSATQGNFFFQNGIGCSGPFTSVTYFGSGRKPSIRFSNSITGTAVETVAGSSASAHLATGSNDYLYSNHDRLLLRLSGISTTLGCVNSSLENGGTAWVSYLGGQRSAKVFAVTPSNNTASASYTISLYFDNAELGGKIPSTLKLAKTSAASAAASNSSNTIMITPVLSSLGSGTTVFTGSFTGFSRFFLVDAGVTLATGMVGFNGKATSEHHALLDWETSFEENNRGFELEVSRNNSDFTLLAVIPSQGPSTSPQFYQYLHQRPEAGITFYRLKQVDDDGAFKYSRAIAINQDREVAKASVFPVPAKNVITLQFGRLVNTAEIELYSADMKFIRKEKVNTPSVKRDIDISTLPRGIYFIRLSGVSGVDLLRFVKQ